MVRLRLGRVHASTFALAFPLFVWCAAVLSLRLWAAAAARWATWVACARAASLASLRSHALAAARS